MEQPWAMVDQALAEIQSLLGRMRSLALIATHEALGQEDRTAIQAEIDQLSREIDRAAARIEALKTAGGLP